MNNIALILCLILFLLRYYLYNIFPHPYVVLFYYGGYPAKHTYYSTDLSKSEFYQVYKYLLHVSSMNITPDLFCGGGFFEYNVQLESCTLYSKNTPPQGSPALYPGLHVIHGKLYTSSPGRRRHERRNPGDEVGKGLRTRVF